MSFQITSSPTKLNQVKKSAHLQELRRARDAVCDEPPWSLPPHQHALAPAEGSTCCKVPAENSILVHNHFPEWWQSLRWLTRLEPSFLMTSASNQSVTDLLRSSLYFPHFTIIYHNQDSWVLTGEPLGDPMILYCFLGLQPVKACKHSVHKGTSKASRWETPWFGN